MFRSDFHLLSLWKPSPSPSSIEHWLAKNCMEATGECSVIVMIGLGAVAGTANFLFANDESESSCWSVSRGLVAVSEELLLLSSQIWRLGILFPRVSSTFSSWPSSLFSTPPSSLAWDCSGSLLEWVEIPREEPGRGGNSSWEEKIRAFLKTLQSVFLLFLEDDFLSDCASESSFFPFLFFFFFDLPDSESGRLTAPNDLRRALSLLSSSSSLEPKTNMGSESLST